MNILRAITSHAQAERAKLLVVGDVRDMGRGKRLAAVGIARTRQNEAHSTRTCCRCGAINTPTTRTCRCRSCGLGCHRDANGAVNQESTVLYGA